MNRTCQIDFIDTPIDIRDKYQYFEAKMSKLRGVGFKDAFFTLEEGIEDYIVNYLPLANIISMPILNKCIPLV